MTTRFSLTELAEMFGQPVTAVREAVEQLSRRGELSAESFLFGQRSWRIAPSDTRKIKNHLNVAQRNPNLNLGVGSMEPRPTRRKQIRKIMPGESLDS
ncbi:hypothetical protein D2Q93_01970 [Alicyclobacillaceae bacterium I2511]|nr:hypothetical protein D2Q93_01970 [Alicyclobacillaceae bacterium I2511]